MELHKLIAWFWKIIFFKLGISLFGSLSDLNQYNNLHVLINLELLCLSKQTDFLIDLFYLFQVKQINSRLVARKFIDIYATATLFKLSYWFELFAFKLFFCSNKGDLKLCYEALKLKTICTYEEHTERLKLMLLEFSYIVVRLKDVHTVWKSIRL